MAGLGGLVKAGIEAITGPVATYFTRRAELKLERHKADIAVIQASADRAARAVSEGLAADAAWELESLRAHAGGWKDEFVLAVLSLPLILCFFPQTAPAVLRGFEVLERTPGYFKLLVVAIFGAIYGLRMWRRQQYDTE
jgi:hypothetical protein